MTEGSNEFPEPGEGPVVRDKRRFDPATGERREGVPDFSAASPDVPGASAPGTQGGGANEELVAELTADLQRLQAEYANYRRRVERDREAVGEAALASVIIGLLPVLDDLDRARAHGEVTGGFALVADGLENTLAKLGLTRFGESGDPFDPTVHEALTHGYSGEVSEPVCGEDTHGYSGEVSEPVCGEVFQPGYQVGDRVLRPARVAVLEPETTPVIDVPTEPANE